MDTMMVVVDMMMVVMAMENRDLEKDSAKFICAIHTLHKIDRPGLDMAKMPDLQKIN